MEYYEDREWVLGGGFNDISDEEFERIKQEITNKGKKKDFLLFLLFILLCLMLVFAPT